MRISRTAAPVANLLVCVAVPFSTVTGFAAQTATPPASYSCKTVTAASPIAGVTGMEMGTPMAGMDHSAMGLDLVYIDMMIPHHASIIAMAQAALPRLDDERLREIARAIVATQQPEIAELRQMREAISGEAEPMPMDDAMMTAMDELMPGMSGTMDDMAFQMDAAAQVAAICAAEDTDLAFIELTIPHHLMAIEASEVVVEQSERAELRDFAHRVIVAQQREIETLTAIRHELTGAATPPATSTGPSTDNQLHHQDAAAMAVADGAGIQALDSELVAQIERGEGAGLALPAERNGVPGPRYVLDLAADLGLTMEQRVQVQTIFDAMKSTALPTGQRYLTAVRALETDFRSGTLELGDLPARIAKVSRLAGELAAIHPAAHLQTAAVLTVDQLATYNRLRGTG